MLAASRPEHRRQGRSRIALAHLVRSKVDSVAICFVPCEVGRVEILFSNGQRADVSKADWARDFKDSRASESLTIQAPSLQLSLQRKREAFLRANCVEEAIPCLRQWDHTLRLLSEERESFGFRHDLVAQYLIDLIEIRAVLGVPFVVTTGPLGAVSACTSTAKPSHELQLHATTLRRGLKMDFEKLRAELEHVPPSVAQTPRSGPAPS